MSCTFAVFLSCCHPQTSNMPTANVSGIFCSWIRQKMVRLLPDETPNLIKNKIKFEINEKNQSLWSTTYVFRLVHFLRLFQWPLHNQKKKLFRSEFGKWIKKFFTCFVAMTILLQSLHFCPTFSNDLFDFHLLLHLVQLYSPKQATLPGCKIM